MKRLEANEGSAVLGYDEREECGERKEYREHSGGPEEEQLRSASLVEALLGRVAECSAEASSTLLQEDGSDE